MTDASEFQQTFSDLNTFDLVAGSVFGLRYYEHYLNGPSDEDIVLEGWAGVTWHSSELEAVCLSKPQHVSTCSPSCCMHLSHYVPKPSCTCGIYAYWQLPPQSVEGINAVVEGTGRTLIGTAGFRTQHAKIVALSWPHRASRASGSLVASLPKHRGQILSDKYGVTVYSCLAEMLLNHPTTQDYLPTSVPS